MAVKHTFKYLKQDKDGAKEVWKTENLTRQRAIYYHCMDCSGGSIWEANRCEIKECPLYPYRGSSKIKIKPEKMPVRGDLEI